MTIFRTLLLLLLAYLVFVVFSLPASFATKRLNAAVQQVQVNDVEGSIWSGDARDIRYQGVPIGALEWRARPLGVLQGEWKNHLRLNGVIAGEGELAVAVNGLLNLYDTRLDTTLPALIQTLGRRIPVQVRDYRGEIAADISKAAIEIESRQLDWLEGVFELRKLQSSDAQYLGDFAADVSTIGKGRYKAVVNSTSDRGLQVDGVITTNLQGDIELDIKVAKVELLGEQAASLIQRFMKKTDDGYYRFRWQGNIKYLKMFLG